MYPDITSETSSYNPHFRHEGDESEAPFILDGTPDLIPHCVCCGDDCAHDCENCLKQKPSEDLTPKDLTPPFPEFEELSEA